MRESEGCCWTGADPSPGRRPASSDHSSLFATLLVAIGSLCVLGTSAPGQDIGASDVDAERYDSRSASEWGALLASEDVALRKKAAYALWVLGKRAAGESSRLVAGLRDSDAYVREVSGKALARMGAAASAALPAVIDLLADPDEGIRREGALLCTLLGSPDETQVARLEQHAQSKDAAVRAGVAGALGSAPSQSKGARRALTVLLDDAEEVVSRSAASALARLDPLAGLRAERLDVRAAAVALQQRPGARGADIVAALAGALDDPEEEIRARAASSLGMPGVLSAETADEKLVRSLTEALAQPGETVAVRSQLLYALGRAAAWRPEAAGPLVKAIDDEEADLRFAALVAIGWSGSAGGTAAPVLVKCLSDRDPRVRAVASRSLAAVAPTKETVAAIEHGLFDQERSVRVASADSLGLLGSSAESAIPAMTKCLRGQADRATVAAVAASVLVIGKASDELREELRKHFRSSERPPASVALALLRLEPEAQEAVVSRVADALLSELEHFPALGRLVHVGPGCALLVSPLGAGLKSTDRQVRMRAARALGAIRGTALEAGAILKAGLSDPDPEVREVIQSSLSDRKE